MLKAFCLTFLFWSLFTLTNSIGDAIDFYQAFIWYGNMDLWHFLKYWWIGFAVLTGWFSCNLYNSLWIDDIVQKPKWYKLNSRIGITLYFLLWFLFLRWILFETLMEKWRQV